MNNIVQLNPRIETTTEHQTAFDSLKHSIEMLRQSNRMAQKSTRAFSNSNRDLKAAIERLEKSARNYRDVLHTLDAQPLRRKSLRLALLMDNAL